MSIDATRATAEGMISRRSLIARLAVLPASAAPGYALTAPQAPSSIPEPERMPAAAPGLRPAERALHHWREFVAAMGEIDPSVERWMITGDSSAATVRGMRVLREDVGRGLVVDVDRVVYTGCLSADALWSVEAEE